MKHFSRYILLLCALLLVCTEGAAQDGKWREMHKVKAKETLYGIAREYGLTVDELVKANPEMGAPDYKLKKGDYIFIPYAKGDAAGKAAQGRHSRAPDMGGGTDRRIEQGKQCVHGVRFMKNAGLDTAHGRGLFRQRPLARKASRYSGKIRSRAGAGRP